MPGTYWGSSTNAEFKRASMLFAWRTAGVMAGLVGVVAVVATLVTFIASAYIMTIVFLAIVAVCGLLYYLSYQAGRKGVNIVEVLYRAGQILRMSNEAAQMLCAVFYQKYMLPLEEDILSAPLGAAELQADLDDIMLDFIREAAAIDARTLHDVAFGGRRRLMLIDLATRAAEAIKHLLDLDEKRSRE